MVTKRKTALKKMIRKVTKVDIINKIMVEDRRQGKFYKNGQYRYGIKYYYGGLNKYNKDKLNAILKNLKRTSEKK